MKVGSDRREEEKEGRQGSRGMGRRTGGRKEVGDWEEEMTSVTDQTHTS